MRRNGEFWLKKEKKSKPNRHRFYVDKICCKHLYNSKCVDRQRHDIVHYLTTLPRISNIRGKSLLNHIFSHILKFEYDSNINQ